MSVPSPDLLLVMGPGLLFVMALAETSVPAGLLVPAGVALALGAFLAWDGYLPVPAVLVASGTGALAGDSLGFWLGRRGGGRLVRVGGPVGRLIRRYEASTGRLYRKHPLTAVSLARTVSFVRTLMPATAGMSGMSYPRFLAFDVVGVVAWLALYVVVGILAGESWRLVSGVLGTGWAVLFLLAGLGAFVLHHRRQAREAAAADPVVEE
jgi:membrane-associated protein